MYIKYMSTRHRAISLSPGGFLGIRNFLKVIFIPLISCKVHYEDSSGHVMLPKKTSLFCFLQKMAFKGIDRTSQPLWTLNIALKTNGKGRKHGIVLGCISLPTRRI